VTEILSSLLSLNLINCLIIRSASSYSYIGTSTILAQGQDKESFSLIAYGLVYVLWHWALVFDPIKLLICKYSKARGADSMYPQSTNTPSDNTVMMWSLKF
jgi:hypothetical protein